MGTGLWRGGGGRGGKGGEGSAKSAWERKVGARTRVLARLREVCPEHSVARPRLDCAILSGGGERRAVV
eukprot:6175356-Pleurochrysis_carterae.AAC.1